MTRKNILLIGVLLLLTAFCVYLYRDRFLPEPIQIGHRSVEPRGWLRRREKNSEADAIVFLLNQEIKLTSVKVVSLDELATNKNAAPLWELVSESNSIPVKDFIYGLNIRGMRPVRKGASAQPLEAGAHYRLYLKSGWHKLQHDFSPLPRKS